MLRPILDASHASRCLVVAAVLGSLVASLALALIEIVDPYLLGTGVALVIAALTYFLSTAKSDKGKAAK
jgi:hypothetical protein